MTVRDPQSWAHHSITRRWPEIARRIFTENELPPASAARLEALIADLPGAPIRAIDDPGAPDQAAWNGFIAPYQGQDWLSPPWFFSEHYFYRRILEAIGYFQPGAGLGFDPFVLQKRQGLAISGAAIDKLASRLASWLASGVSAEILARMLSLDLWGNQADLSMWPAEGNHKPDHADAEGARAFLLADDGEGVVAHLLERAASPGDLRVDILVDNAGFELVCDLALADLLLSGGLAKTVRLHLKPHPTYVSDAMAKDVWGTAATLEAADHAEVSRWGARLQEHIQQDRLQARENFFWTSPLPAWEMPSPLREELSAAGLVISKGDAHYRRLLGDLAWPSTTPFVEILAYFPAPLVALRTVKAEIICGLQPGQASQVQRRDPQWMIDGRWGLIQAVGLQP
jgi:hypothetical protein